MVERELERLEQNAERSRADLAETVDELRSRVSSTADDVRHHVSVKGLKEDLSEYAGRTRQEIVRNLKQKASENPLGAVAVGAGVAYMGWRILRSIPTPLLLLGGGLALLKSDRRGNGTSVMIGQDAKALSDPGAAGIKSTVASSMEAVRAHVGEAAASAGDAANRMASAAASAVSDVASSAYHSGVRATAYAGDQAVQAGRKTQDTFIDTFERHPLLVGSVGVLIGALLGGSLPATEAERRLVGEKSDEIKERAFKVASEGYGVAEAAGRRVVKQALDETGEDIVREDEKRSDLRSNDA